jgi:hypothetical protein
MKPDVYETFDRYHENKILHPTSSVVVDHTARILDLEKQVAELRAATKEAGYIANYMAKFEALLKEKE